MQYHVTANQDMQHANRKTIFAASHMRLVPAETIFLDHIKDFTGRGTLRNEGWLTHTEKLPQFNGTTRFLYFEDLRASWRARAWL